MLRESPRLCGEQRQFDTYGSVPTGLSAFAFVLPFAFKRSRKGPFEGPATVKPPALPNNRLPKSPRQTVCAWRRGGKELADHRPLVDYGSQALWHEQCRTNLAVHEFNFPPDRKSTR